MSNDIMQMIAFRKSGRSLAESYSATIRKAELEDVSRVAGGFSESMQNVKAYIDFLQNIQEVEFNRYLDERSSAYELFGVVYDRSGETAPRFEGLEEIHSTVGEYLGSLYSKFNECVSAGACDDSLKEKCVDVITGLSYLTVAGTLNQSEQYFLNGGGVDWNTVRIDISKLTSLIPGISGILDVEKAKSRIFDKYLDVHGAFGRGSSTVVDKEVDKLLEGDWEHPKYWYSGYDSIADSIAKDSSPASEFVYTLCDYLADCVSGPSMETFNSEAYIRKSDRLISEFASLIVSDEYEKRGESWLDIRTKLMDEDVPSEEIRARRREHSEKMSQDEEEIKQKLIAIRDGMLTELEAYIRGLQDKIRGIVDKHRKKGDFVPKELKPLYSMMG